ncbi:unnamed protein product [Trifolium pratense]|uniref:Uncharacterized protein n=1 Tax=Trifolium pratense TaxID=57577 RepID=A0ACB0JJS0_TRIPR|nr:unnamed protein product [Trifolium pratense]
MEEAVVYSGSILLDHVLINDSSSSKQKLVGITVGAISFGLMATCICIMIYKKRGRIFFKKQQIG